MSGNIKCVCGHLHKEVTRAWFTCANCGQRWVHSDAGWEMDSEYKLEFKTNKEGFYGVITRGGEVVWEDKPWRVDDGSAEEAAYNKLYELRKLAVKAPTRPTGVKYTNQKIGELSTRAELRVCTFVTEGIRTAGEEYITREHLSHAAALSSYKLIALKKLAGELGYKLEKA